MAVTAQHEVDASGSGHQFGIIDAVDVPTQVGEADDDVAFLLFQHLHHLIRLLDGVEILEATVVCLAHQSSHLGTNAEDTNLQALALEDDIGFHDLGKFSAREVVVAAHDGELRHLEEAHHVVESEVKLVVADGGGIVFHLVHQPHFHIALEERVVRRALREVATVEEQQVGVLLAFLLDHRHPAQVTATVSHRRVGEVGIERHDARVGVVGVEYHQFLLCHHVHGTDTYNNG